jgi:hypothetical protein
MGSKLFPNTYNGKQRSGGFFAKNQYRGQNAKAPDYKGRVWLNSAGWFWIAVWMRKSPEGQPYGSVQLTDMSDEEAKKYCARTEHRDPHRRAPADEPSDDFL